MRGGGGEMGEVRVRAVRRRGEEEGGGKDGYTRNLFISFMTAAFRSPSAYAKRSLAYPYTFKAIIQICLE